MLGISPEQLWIEAILLISLQKFFHFPVRGLALIPNATAALWAFPRYPFFAPDRTW